MLSDEYNDYTITLNEMKVLWTYYMCSVLTVNIQHSSGKARRVQLVFIMS